LIGLSLTGNHSLSLSSKVKYSLYIFLLIGNYYLIKNSFLYGIIFSIFFTIFMIIVRNNIKNFSDCDLEFRNSEILIKKCENDRAIFGSKLSNLVKKIIE